MKKTNKQNGITLVALVITIIILIILAGISISALSGSGLFERAQQAQKESENAQANEDATLAEYGQWMTNYIGGTSGGGKTTLENAEAAKPAGATITVTNASQGIVMVDSKNNEWVWVEVPISVTAGKTTDSDIETALKGYATDYREGSAEQGFSWTDEWYDGCGMTKTEYNTAKSKMLQSIKTNGGFWISRYEAGIKGSDTDTTKARKSHTDITDSSIEAVSQANMIPYNYVYCSEAQTLASGMSTDSNKKSSLLFGIQWDLVCKFLQEKGGLSVEEIKGGDDTGSTNWGNYKNAIVTPIKTGAKQLISDTWTASTTDKPDNSSILLTTGASDYTKKMNIYDFAGNEWEWTLEKTSIPDVPCAYRGGSYYDYGSNSSASYRDYGFTTDSYDNIGFRSALY